MDAELAHSIWNRLMDLRDRTKPTTDDERRDTQHLPVKLTDAELLACGMNNATARKQIAQMERELKAAQQKIKADVEALEAVIDVNTECISTGRQERPVECVILLDTPKRGQKTTYRLDTLESVRTETMTGEESQRMMRLEEAKAPKKPATREKASAPAAEAPPATDTPEVQESTPTATAAETEAVLPAIGGDQAS